VVLSVVYQPLAMFRVLPMTRCSDSMPGHTDAVLHVSFSPDGTILASGGGDGTVRYMAQTSLLGVRGAHTLPLPTSPQ
jgi:ribosome assembly protein 4